MEKILRKFFRETKTVIKGYKNEYFTDLQQLKSFFEILYNYVCIFLICIQMKL